MAEVTEIIHKITYEVNNEALINATKSIQAQIKELNALGKSIASYARQLEELGNKETKQLDELSRKIEEVNSKVAASEGQ